MSKRLVFVWYPIVTRVEQILEVEIPDDEDPNEWLSNHREDIVDSIDNGESMANENSFDLGYAGVKFVEDRSSKG